MFSNSVTEIIEGCIERGMQFPLVLVCVPTNGNIMASRYQPAGNGKHLKVQILVEPRQDQMLSLPVNIIIVDARGEATRVVITNGGTTFH